MQFGIDLGTTNSLISVFKDGHPKLIGKEAPLMPSVVGVLDGAVLVGSAAKERQVVHPKETVAAFKRAMGTQKKFQLGSQAYSAIDLSALILSSLKDQASAEMGVEVKDVVISVPAYFNHLQRQAVRAAALAAGLNPMRLINEPTAAAIAYGLHDIDEEGHILVFDLGGGTFDVSIVEVFEGVIEVKATSGDAFLGGEDFTKALYKHLAKTHDIDLTDPEQAALLWNASETLKTRLSTAHEAQCVYAWQGRETTLTTTRDQFAEIVAPLVLRLRLPVERAMYDAGLARGQIEKVVLVGGATRMPLIRSQVSRMTGRLPESGLNPDHVVALGACVQAGLTAKDAALDDIVMTDVTAFSLGFAVGRKFGDWVEQGYFDPVIERNTTVPVSREQIFSTMEIGQTELELELYQGEAPRVRDNIKLGSLKLKIPKNRKEHESVSVRLSYDSSGLIEIDTKVLSTGATRSIVITDLTGALSKEDVEARRKVLSALKTHPKDEQANIALVARLERCFAMAIADDRTHIQEMLIAFQQTLDRQIPSEVEALFGTIIEQLDMFEDGYVR